MNRNLTGKINYLIDNVMPPILRDRRILMRLLFTMGLGHRNAGLYMDFKRDSANLSEQQIQEYYGKTQHVNNRPTDLNSTCMEYILSEVAKQCGSDSVLDISCGRGFLSRQIALQGKQVTAVDIIIPGDAPHTEGLTFVRGDILDIPFIDHSFDIVISTHTLEHVLDLKRALSELRRVCRETLIIVVPRQREYRYTPDLHLHFFPYCESFQRVANNPEGQCFLMGGDIVYREQVRNLP